MYLGSKAWIAQNELPEKHAQWTGSFTEQEPRRPYRRNSTCKQ